MPENEPGNGIEVFRSIGRLGLDVSSAIKSGEELAKSLERLDTSLSKLVSSAKQAGPVVNELFSKSFGARAFQDTLKAFEKYQKQMDVLLLAQQKKELTNLSQAELKKVLTIQKSEAEIAAIKEAARRQEERQEELHKQKLLQQEELHAKRVTAIELRRRGAQTPWSEAFGYRASWFVSGTIFYGSLRAAQALVNISAEVEDAMARVRSVMDAQATDFGRLQASIIDAAKAYGQLVPKLADATIEWAKQGRTQTEIQELLRPTALLANVGDIEDVTEAVRLLTAATKQFNIPASQAVDVIDKWTAVADATAVSVQDLGEATAIAGKVAYTMGITFDQLAAHAAALGEATGKSGREVGQSLKTIYAYLYRPETVALLEQMGFRVKENADSFRDFNDILGDIAQKWNTMTNVEQHALAMKAAGARRISDFITLLEVHNRTVEATIVAMSSMGSAERKNEEIMQTYNKQVQQLRASIQELCVEMGEAGLLDILKGVTNMSSRAIENFKHWNPVLRQTVEVLGMVAGTLTAVNVAWNFFGHQTLLQAIGKGDAMKGLATIAAFVKGLAGIPWVAWAAGIAAVGVGAASLAAGIKKGKEEAGELARKLEEHLRSYDALAKVMGENEKGTVEYTVASREQVKVMNAIAELVPDMIEAYDEQGNAIKFNREELEKLIAKQKEYAGQTSKQLFMQREQVRAQLEDIRKNRDKWIKQLAEETPLGSAAGVIQPDIEAAQIVRRQAEQALRDFESGLRKQEELLSQSLYAEAQSAVLARYSAITQAFGAQEAWYIDPTTEKRIKGMFPFKQEALMEEERDIWPGLEKTLPVIAKADEAIKQLEQQQKALTLQHEREIALLPSYASAIDEVNLKIKQNAALIKENQVALATATSERDAIQRALKAEEDRLKQLGTAWNNMTKEEQDSPAGKKHAQQLQEAQKNVSALQSKYDALDKQVTDYQNNSISLTTKGIELAKQRNRLLDEYNESLKKAQRTLEDLLGINRELAELRHKTEMTEILFGAESPEAYMAQMAELLAERRQVAQDIARLAEDFAAKYPTEKAFREARPEDLVDFQTKMNTLLAQREDVDRRIEKLDAEENKRREEKAKETAKKIAENELTIREDTIKKDLAAIDAALAKEEQGSPRYLELEQARDNLLIEQHKLNIERLRKQLRYADLIDWPAIESQIAEEQNEITKLQAGIVARADKFAKDLAAKNKEIDLSMLELTDPIKAGLAKVDEDVEKAFEGITDRDLDKERKRLAGYWEVWKKAAEEEATKIVEDVHLAPFDKLQKLQELNAQLMAKSLDGVSGSPVIKDAIDRLASEIVDAQNAAIRERAEAEGWGLDLALAEIAVSDKAESVKAKLRREAIERYLAEDLGRVTSSLILTPEQQLEAVDALLEKYAAFKDEVPEAYASLTKAQEELKQRIDESNAELARQRLAIQQAGLEAYTDATEQATKNLEDFRTATQGQARDIALVKRELDLTSAVLGKTREEYEAIRAETANLAQKLGQPLLGKLAAGQVLTPEERKELESWQQALKPETKATYETFLTLLQLLPQLDSKIIALTATITSLSKEIELIPVQDRFAALNASLDEFSRLMAETALAEEYFADGLFADVKRMELLRQKMQATKEVGEAYKDALKTTTDKLKELLPQDAALFDAIASGLPLTKEQSERWGELNARLDMMPDAVKTLLPLLTSLRDKNGEVSKSILDQAFALYRATLAAKGLAKAYDAVVSGAEELRDRFDYRQDLGAMEARYNFNYLFGRPAERAMEDWQAEFDAVRADMEAIARISAGVRLLGGTQEDEQALAKLKEELRALAKEQPALGLTEQQIEAFGTDAAQAMDIAATAASNLEGRLESLVSRRYFLELAREAEEMGKTFEENIEGAFQKALSDLISGKGDLLNILATFGESVVSGMADMLAKGLTRRIFGDPNDPNSLAGRITQWATGQAGDALGIQTSMTTGAQIAGSTIQTAIVTGGQQVASMWSTALRMVPVGTPGGVPIPGTMPTPEQGSVAGWRLLEAASMAGTAATMANTMPAALEGSVAGWRMLEAASMASTAGVASGGGGFLAALLGGGGTALAGFDPVTMLATFAIATIMSGIQKKLSQPLAPKPQDQYVYRITSPEFNPFSSPERVYYAGTGREGVEVRNFNINIERIVAADGTDAGTKIFQRIKQLERSGTWGRTR